MTASSHSGPHPLAASCTRCPALVANRQRIVHGYGDVPARTLFVGEAPGYLGADRTGVPFTGDRSGRRLQALLIAVGLSLEVDPAVERPVLRDAYVTNVVRCNPPANRNPTAAEVASCTPYLHTEIMRVRPQVVVALGAVATRWAFAQLLGKALPSGIRSLHGQTWPTGTATLLCLVHPARASARRMTEAEGALQTLLAVADERDILPVSQENP